MTTKDCIFCKIAKKELPANIIYEDEKTIAFLDANPVHPGHTLVIPKKHSINILDIPEKDFLRVMKTVRKISPGIKECVKADGINIAQSSGKAANQEVFHLHVHIIPRFKDDGYKFGFPHFKYKKGEAKETADKIKGQL